MNYTTHTQVFINRLYSKLRITKPSQLDFIKIATSLEIKIFIETKQVKHFLMITKFIFFLTKNYPVYNCDRIFAMS